MIEQFYDLRPEEMCIRDSSLATVLFTRLVGGVYGPTVSTIVMTLLVLTFGEITPKSCLLYTSIRPLRPRRV